MLSALASRLREKLPAALWSSGVWAPADSGAGLGRALLALPDISGDGALDVLMATDCELRAYRGPGR